jgi:hypothetical protein
MMKKANELLIVNYLPILPHSKTTPDRSLAGLSRNKGAYAKTQTPFAEFLWADYFRLHIPVKEIHASLDESIDIALKLAKKSQASYLPGWSGNKELK